MVNHYIVDVSEARQLHSGGVTDKVIILLNNKIKLVLLSFFFLNHSIQILNV